LALLPLLLLRVALSLTFLRHEKQHSSQLLQLYREHSLQ
jgi:hypothetical protein